MPRPASGVRRVRLNLEVPEAIRMRMEELQRLTEADSLTEVIRRSLSVYEALVRAQLEGREVTIRDADGTSRGLQIIP